MSTPSRKASWERDGDGQSLEENWLFRLRRERFRSRATGKAHDFYVMHLADAVNVVALTPDRRIVLVRQFRAGSGRDSLETPGGLLDPGEDPLAAGVRELREETGYEGDPPILLSTAWSNPSIMTSRITTILITNARQVAGPKLDASEEVIVELIYSNRVPEWIADGRIDHALAVQGLLAWLVSELPGTALTKVIPRRGRRTQVTIRTIMLWVAGIAVFFGLMRWIGSADRIVAMLGYFAAAFAVSVMIVYVLLDPPQSAILERAGRMRLGCQFTRFLAVLALWPIVLGMMAIVAGELSR